MATSAASLFTPKLKLSNDKIVVLLSFTESKLRLKLKKHKITYPKNL